MKPDELIEQGRFLGEEFLFWLWMRGLSDGGTSGLKDDVSACFLDDSVQLASERGDVKEIRLRKGNPAECREAFEALSRGMRPVKAKVRILAGDMEWVFSLESETLNCSGLKLPPSQSKDPGGYLADRSFLIEEGLRHLERRFRAFLNIRTLSPSVLADRMREWVGSSLLVEA